MSETAHTMAEKLLTNHNLAGAPARAGDFVEARIDGAMCHYHANEPMWDMAIEAGFKDGLPRVWDRDRVYVLLDHHQPTLTQKLADENALIRREVGRLGIRCFHDSEPGKVVGVHLGEGPRLQRVQRLRPACHGAGVPVLQQPAGGQHPSQPASGQGCARLQPRIRVRSKDRGHRNSHRFLKKVLRLSSGEQTVRHCSVNLCPTRPGRVRKEPNRSKP